MDSIKLGETIARERRARGVTQEALAQHMGVTKAAVSKWELGQSMPDVALLPRLAAYFGLSLDALFDYHAELSRREVSHIYRAIWEELQRDEASAYRMLVDAAAEHYASWNLLVSLAGLLEGAFIGRATAAGDTDAVERYRAKLVELCKRVEDNAADVDLQTSARQMHVGWLMRDGAEGIARAIALLEPYAPKTSTPNVTLATLYDLNGQHERATELRRGIIRHALFDLMSCTALAIDQENAAAVAALDKLGRALNELFGFADGDNPSGLMSTCLMAAPLLMKHGMHSQAVDALAYCVDVLERRLHRLRTVGDGAIGTSEGIAAPLHGLLERADVGDAEAMWDATGLSQVDIAGTEDMLKMLAGMVQVDDEDTAPLADDARWRALRARLARYAAA